METLRQKQSRFAEMVALLLHKMKDEGYEVTFGETKRSDEQAELNAIGEAGRARVADLVRKEFPVLAAKIVNNGKNNGVRNSVHQLCLAIDLNLFKDGVFLSSGESHRSFGTWWKSLSTDARWGGDWGDGNHYSLEHEGVK